MKSFAIFTRDNSTRYERFTVFLLVTSLFNFICILAVMVVQVSNYTSTKNLDDCTMENCIEVATYCGVNTCMNGKCVYMGNIPGCCDPSTNCTESSTEANYAFNSICYNEISNCSSFLSSASYSFQRERTDLQPLSPLEEIIDQFKNHIESVKYDDGIEEVTVEFEGCDNKTVITAHKLGKLLIVSHHPFSVVLTSNTVQSRSISRKVIPGLEFRTVAECTGSMLVSYLAFDYESISYYVDSALIVNSLNPSVIGLNCTFGKHPIVQI